MSHFELTDNRHPEFPNLRQIRATQPIQRWGVSTGTWGGYVEREDNLRGEAWITEGSIIQDYSVVGGRALVRGGSIIRGGAYVVGDAIIYNSTLEDEAHVSDDVFVSNSTIRGAAVKGNLRVENGSEISGDDTYLRGYGTLVGAQIGESSHLLEVLNIGSEGVVASIYRTAKGHTLSVGCWTGTLDDLMDEVDDRSHGWMGTHRQMSAWRDQYRGLLWMGRATVDMWEKEG